MPTRILSPLKKLIHDSRSVGIFLLVCTAISLCISNTGLGGAYTSFWNVDLIHVPGVHLPHSPLHIINDVLMSIFFLMAGMEIKRELLTGELASLQKSLLPVIAAIGGMVVPAALYFMWCGGTPFAHGWGIPLATDIAFSLGVLSLLGKRAPASLRVFLTALAIIDDIGGIIVIAAFYAGSLNSMYMMLAGGVFILLLILNVCKVRYISIYMVLGAALWYCVYRSGIHATIAGVLLAFTIPLGQLTNLEHKLHMPVNFLVLPLFALANTAIVFPADMGMVFTSRLHYGVFTGLLLGKPIGILLFSFIAVKSGLAKLPDNINWKHIGGVGFIAGIGFTVSIFITTLAITEPELQTVAKIAVINASLLAGIIGFFLLKLHARKHPAT